MHFAPGPSSGYLIQILNIPQRYLPKQLQGNDPNSSQTGASVTDQLQKTPGVCGTEPPWQQTICPTLEVWDLNVVQESTVSASPRSLLECNTPTSPPPQPMSTQSEFSILKQDPGGFLWYEIWRLWNHCGTSLFLHLLGYHLLHAVCIYVISHYRLQASCISCLQ